MMAATVTRISRPRRPILGTGERTTTSAVTSPSPASTVRARVYRTRSPRYVTWPPDWERAAISLPRADRRPRARPDVGECGKRAVEVRHLDEGQASRQAAQRLGTVVRGSEEIPSTDRARRDHLLRDAADRPHIAVVVHGAGAGDDPAAGEIGRTELVDD